MHLFRRLEIFLTVYYVTHEAFLHISGNANVHEPADFDKAISATGKTALSRRDHRITTVSHAFRRLPVSGYGLFNVLLLLAALPIAWTAAFDTTSGAFILASAECELELTFFRKGVLVAFPYVGRTHELNSTDGIRERSHERPDFPSYNNNRIHMGLHNALRRHANALHPCVIGWLDPQHLEQRCTILLCVPTSQVRQRCSVSILFSFIHGESVITATLNILEARNEGDLFRFSELFYTCRECKFKTGITKSLNCFPFYQGKIIDINNWSCKDRFTCVLHRNITLLQINA